MGTVKGPRQRDLYASYGGVPLRFRRDAPNRNRALNAGIPSFIAVLMRGKHSICVGAAVTPSTY